MYKKIYKGKIILLPNKDWEKLRRRFDRKKYKSKGQRMYTDVPCPLCEKYYNQDPVCLKCPVHQYATRVEYGCEFLMNGFRLDFENWAFQISEKLYLF